MNIELQKLEKNDIQSKVRFDLDQQQREYFPTNENHPGRIGYVSQEEEMDEMFKV
jgi:ATP-dependent Lon protease